jgi:hypothetical protein
MGKLDIVREHRGGKAGTEVRGKKAECRTRNISDLLISDFRFSTEETGLQSEIYNLQAEVLFSFWILPAYF